MAQTVRQDINWYFKIDSHRYKQSNCYAGEYSPDNTEKENSLAEFC